MTRLKPPRLKLDAVSDETDVEGDISKRIIRLTQLKLAVSADQVNVQKMTLELRIWSDQKPRPSRLFPLIATQSGKYCASCRRMTIGHFNNSVEKKVCLMAYGDAKFTDRSG